MLLTAPLLAIAFLTSADPAKGLEGTWEGFLNPNPSAEVRLILRIEKDSKGTWQAKAESPEVKQPTMTFEEVTVDGNKLVMISKTAGREFRGTLDPASDELKGDWKKGSATTPLTFQRVEGPVLKSDVWEGALSLNGGIKLRLVFHALKSKGGELRSTMDSPDQGVFGMKVTTTEVGKDSLKFVIKNVGEYEGKVDPTGNESTGLWKQGGANLPLILMKVAEVSEIRRPQNPKGPFPYTSEDVAYDSRAKGVRIAGTLTIPEGDGPFPVALLITGSGAQDRDETLLGHKPFLVLADDLSRRGIAVLRVDDRGVGGSTGNPTEATTMDFVEDVLGGIDFLKAHKRIDPKRIGLIGHSEGGLIGPIVATKSSDVAFIVMLAGPGLPGDQILVAQMGLILKVAGAEEAKIKSARESQSRLIAIAKDAPDSKQALERLKTTYAEMVKALPEEERKALAAADPASSQLAMLASPWFRFFLSYDPRPTLAKVTCPILAINGENDLQVPCKENLEAIDKAVRSGGNRKIVTREMPSLNHLFQTSKTGAPSEYGTIEETFSPAALKVVGDWVVEQTHR